MKRVFAALPLAAALLCASCGYVSQTAPPPSDGGTPSLPAMSPSGDPAPTRPSPSPSDGVSASAGREETYTREQILFALRDQLIANGWDPDTSLVVSAQKTERDKDSFYWESAGETVDLSQSARYLVEVRIVQSEDEYAVLEEIYKDAETNPFRREGDYTFVTDYYYFNDADGEPRLAYVAC
ncbi:MAG: hypothetical protein LBI44_02420 [Oscillospiraceae bacterium]|jgi:hypothetical protein|nr:hypothetical protein [Oscillospiraceae bacterium]